MQRKRAAARTCERGGLNRTLTNIKAALHPPRNLHPRTIHTQITRSYDIHLALLSHCFEPLHIMSDSQTPTANSVSEPAQNDTTPQVNNNNNAETSSTTQSGTEPQQVNTEACTDAGPQAGHTNGNPHDAAEGSEQIRETFVADYLWPRDEAAKKVD